MTVDVLFMVLMEHIYNEQYRNRINESKYKTIPESKRYTNYTG